MREGLGSRWELWEADLWSQGCAASSASALVCVWALLPHPRSVKLGRDAASTVQTVVFHLISYYQGGQMNCYSSVLQGTLGWMVEPSTSQGQELDVSDPCGSLPHQDVL